MEIKHHTPKKPKGQRKKLIRKIREYFEMNEMKKQHTKTYGIQLQHYLGTFLV